ncbi:MAG TPA: N-acetylmuramoyl-L-alanine amidase [Malonomonas sp.]
MRPILLFILLLLVANPLLAAVDISVRGKDPVRLDDVYQQAGVPYIAIEDILGAVGLTGQWNSVKHIYRIRTGHGWAEISPASSYLKLSGEYYPLKEKPRFIDGRLRVTDSFVREQLQLLVGQSIYYRNLDPDTDTATAKESGSIEQLFAFLLKKKPRKAGPLIQAVAIDPGHGGLDTGVIAANGYKEKQVNLAVAEKLAKQLKMKLGVPIYLSRNGDYELTIEQRLESASRDDVDLWLLLHAQASLSSELQGVTLFVRPDDLVATAETDTLVTASVSLQLAEQLALSLRETGIAVNGIYPSALLSLGRGDLPTVQIELGYLSNGKEAALLQKSDYQERLAQAMYQGIRRFAELEKEKKHGFN